MNRWYAFIIMLVLSWLVVRLSGVWSAFAPVLFLLGIASKLSTGNAAKLGSMAMGLLVAFFLVYNFISHQGIMMKQMTNIFNMSSPIAFAAFAFFIFTLLGALSAGAGAAMGQLFFPTQSVVKK